MLPRLSKIEEIKHWERETIDTSLIPPPGPIQSPHKHCAKLTDPCWKRNKGSCPPQGLYGVQNNNNYNNNNNNPIADLPTDDSPSRSAPVSRSPKRLHLHLLPRPSAASASLSPPIPVLPLYSRMLDPPPLSPPSPVPFLSLEEPGEGGEMPYPILSGGSPTPLSLLLMCVANED